MTLLPTFAISPPVHIAGWCLHACLLFSLGRNLVRHLLQVMAASCRVLGPGAARGACSGSVHGRPWWHCRDTRTVKLSNVTSSPSARRGSERQCQWCQCRPEVCGLRILMSCMHLQLQACLPCAKATVRLLL